MATKDPVSLKLTPDVTPEAYAAALSSMTPAERAQDLATFRQVIRAPAFWNSLKPKLRGDYFRKGEALRAFLGEAPFAPTTNP